MGTLALLGVLGCGGATSPGKPLQKPIFVAVGAEGTILTSADAATWRSEKSGVSAALTSVAANGTQFVAVGNEGTILTSRNGRVWTAQSSGTEVDLKHVIFHGEQFIAVGGEWSDQGLALMSSDGVTWKRLEAPARYSFHSVAAVGGTIFASAETPHPTIPMALENVVLASVLPSTSNRGGWIDRNLPRFADSAEVGEAQVETLTVGSWNGESTLSRSQDGEEWTTQDLPVDDAHAIAVGPNDLGFVIVGSSSALTSPDGREWSDNSPPIRTGSWLSDVTAGKSSFAAVGLHGTIFTLSSSSEAWLPRASGVSTALYDVTYGPLE